MRPVRREEILDLAAYERSRAEIRAAILEAKRVRAACTSAACSPSSSRTPRRRPLPGPGDGPRRADDAARRRSATSSRPTTSCSAGTGELGVLAPHRARRPRGARPEAARVARAARATCTCKTEDGEKVRPRFDPRQVGDGPALLGAVPQVRRAAAAVPVAAGSRPARSSRARRALDARAARRARARTSRATRRAGEPGVPAQRAFAPGRACPVGAWGCPAPGRAR